MCTLTSAQEIERAPGGAATPSPTCTETALKPPALMQVQILQTKKLLSEAVHLCRR